MSFSGLKVFGWQKGQILNYIKAKPVIISTRTDWLEILVNHKFEICL